MGVDPSTQVTGLIVPTASFTRPSNTTSYSSGQLIANSTTASSVVPLKFNIAPLLLSSWPTFLINGAHLKHTNLASLSAILYVYNSDPSANSGIANGDGGTFSTAESSLLAQFQITTSIAFTDVYKGFGVPTVRNEVPFVLNSSGYLYGLLSSNGAYSPASAEVITASLELIAI